MSRWLTALVFVLLGVAAGLAYGWLVAPVQYVDTIPASLRIDYRADYVLMVAERFHADRDQEAALRQLSFLGAQTPSTVCREAISFAQAARYSDTDLKLLRELDHAMQALSAASTPAGVAP